VQPKIEYARTRAEADAELRAYCQKLGFDPEWLGERKWGTRLDIACNPEYGYEQARRAVEDDKIEIARKEARTARQVLVAADTLIGRIAVDGRFKGSDVHGILQQIADAYVGGQRVNLGLGGQPFDPTAYEVLRQSWKDVGRVAGTIVGCIFTDFVGHLPQDKPALDKGNVGATMDTRRFQGDLLTSVNGIAFNMHVNLTALR
jgi:hypothetical protein